MNSRVRRTPPCGPRLVALLDLDVVPDLRQVAIAADRLRGVQRDDLLVRDREHELAVGAVAQLEDDVDVVAARALPDLRRVQDRHQHLLPADAIHLLADDLLTRFLTRQPSGSHVHMPAPTCLTMPARTSSLWLSATASPGASRRVGRRYRVARTRHRLAGNVQRAAERDERGLLGGLAQRRMRGDRVADGLERGLGLDRDDARLDQLGGLRADGDHAESSP